MSVIAVDSTVLNMYGSVFLDETARAMAGSLRTFLKLHLPSRGAEEDASAALFRALAGDGCRSHLGMTQDIN